MIINYYHMVISQFRLYYVHSNLSFRPDIVVQEVFSYILDLSIGVIIKGIY
jgi:hypothetical protein